MGPTAFCIAQAFQSWGQPFCSNFAKIPHVGWVRRIKVPTSSCATPPYPPIRHDIDGCIKYTLGPWGAYSIRKGVWWVCGWGVEVLGPHSHFLVNKIIHQQKKIHFSKRHAEWADLHFNCLTWLIYGCFKVISNQEIVFMPQYGKRAWRDMYSMRLVVLYLCTNFVKSCCLFSSKILFPVVMLSQIPHWISLKLWILKSLHGCSLAACLVTHDT